MIFARGLQDNWGQRGRRRKERCGQGGLVYVLGLPCNLLMSYAALLSVGSLLHPESQLILWR